MRAYAIGDIHGALSELERVHRLIAEDRERTGDRAAPVVHVGDLCDRGTDSRGVIDFLFEGRLRGENWRMVMGNHDRMMAMFLEDYPREDSHLPVGLYWLHPRVGGEATLASYGVHIEENDRTAAVHRRFRAAVPVAHREFVSELPTHLLLGDLLFVHAGIRPGVPLEEQTEEDLLWIRKPFHDSQADHGALVIHGHTPVEEVTHYGNRVNLDTGAGYGKPLSAVVIEGRDVWRLTEEGRVSVKRG